MVKSCPECRSQCAAQLTCIYGECIVCFTERRLMLLHPCLHGLCENCWSMLRELPEAPQQRRRPLLKFIAKNSLAVCFFLVIILDHVGTYRLEFSIWTSSQAQIHSTMTPATAAVIANTTRTTTSTNGMTVQTCDRENHTLTPMLPQLCHGIMYEVQLDDCLWTIAERFYGYGQGWHFIHRANMDIKNPDLIFPRQMLCIPDLTDIVKWVELMHVNSKASWRAFSCEFRSPVSKSCIFS